MAFRLQPRLGYLAGFLFCAGMIAFALYLQYVQYQNPCPLCVFQRIAWFALGMLFLVATVHGPGRTGAIVYGALLLIVSASGAAIAGRHVWLQHLPKDKVPACGPDLDFMLQQFPLAETLRRVLTGSGECAEKGWTFLGLSIPEWSMGWFVLIGALVLFLTVRALRRTRHT